MQHSRRKDGLDGGFRLYHSATETFNAEMQSFIEVLTYVCNVITEEGVSMSEYKLNKSLFFLLNLQPLLEVQKADYDSFLQRGITTSVIISLKERLIKDLASVLKFVRNVPIIYDEPEAAIAKLHFNGAFGKGIPSPSNYDVECSRAVRSFDVETYRRIRSAFTVEDLEQVESNECKYSVVYILAGYYIDAYNSVVSRILQKAGLNYLLLSRAHANAEDKLDWILEGLTGEKYKMYLDDGSIPPNKAERMSLLTKKYCDTKIKKEIVKLLDDIRKDFKIGTKACSKRDFCEIVFVFTKYMTTDLWRESRFAPNRHMLAKYYGIQEPTYKIKECKKFEKSEDGKNLIRKLQTFSEEH